MKILCLIVLSFVITDFYSQCLGLRDFQSQIKNNASYIIKSANDAMKDIQGVVDANEDSQIYKLLGDALDLSEEAEDASNSLGDQLKELRESFDKCGFYLPLDELKVLEQTAITAGDQLRKAHEEMSLISEYISDKEKKKVARKVIKHLQSALEENEIFLELVFH